MNAICRLGTKSKHAPQIRINNTNEPWFVQDGATHHTANVVLDYLFEIFGDHVLLRKYIENECAVPWPAYTRRNLFQWEYLKSSVPRMKPIDVAM